MTPQDNLAAVIAARLDMLHEDVGEMKSVIKDLATAVTKLALVEERQGQAQQAQERAFKLLEKLEEKIDEVEDRVDILEKDAPLQKQAGAWVTSAVVALAVVAATFAAKKVGLL